MVSAKQILDWTDGRNASSFREFSWAGNTLGFRIVANAGANGLEAMLPLQGPSGTLTTLQRGGSPVAFTTRTVKGVDYAVFNAVGGDLHGGLRVDGGEHKEGIRTPFPGLCPRVRRRPVGLAGARRRSGRGRKRARARRRLRAGRGIRHRGRGQLGERSYGHAGRRGVLDGRPLRRRPHARRRLRTRRAPRTRDVLRQRLHARGLGQAADRQDRRRPSSDPGSAAKTAAR